MAQTVPVGFWGVHISIGGMIVEPCPQLTCLSRIFVVWQDQSFWYHSLPIHSQEVFCTCHSNYWAVSSSPSDQAPLFVALDVPVDFWGIYRSVGGWLLSLVINSLVSTPSRHRTPRLSSPYIMWWSLSRLPRCWTSIRNCCIWWISKNILHRLPCSSIIPCQYNNTKVTILSAHFPPPVGQAIHLCHIVSTGSSRLCSLSTQVFGWLL